MAGIGVIGAGISGLTAAYRLMQDGHAVTVLEASDRTGGVIRSERADGFLVEHGPNSVRASTGPLWEVVRDLGLDGTVVTANDAAATRYVVRDGRPTALPMSVGDFLTTGLFSFRAKLRLLAEPFRPRRSPEIPDESVADFVRRRLGPEVLDYAVAPFVGGVFAGRPDNLSVRHAFGRLAEMEDEHGSLLWAGLRSALNGSQGNDEAPDGLFSFRNGLQALPTALADALGDRLVPDAPVTGLAHSDGRWTVHHGRPNEAASRFDAVVCTIPLHRFADLALDTPVDRTPLREVTYPPLTVVALGYERAAVNHPLDGFGLLVPPVEDDFDILGTLFSSSLFPGRAPDGHVLLTTFVGGTRAPDLARRPDEAIQHVVERDLGRLLGVTGDPVFSRHIHWSNAIPQYTLGYDAVIDTLDALEDAHPGLLFAGNYRQGVSVGDAMASGAAAANRATEALSA